jgi:hypothetical protein
MDTNNCATKKAPAFVDADLTRAVNARLILRILISPVNRNPPTLRISHRRIGTTDDAGSPTASSRRLSMRSSPSSATAVRPTAVAFARNLVEIVRRVDS